MPVSLAEVQKNAQDDIQAGVIDELRRSSLLLDALTFDDAVTPGTNGGTLTYGYTRVSTYGTATTRAFNAEYTAAEAAKQRVTVDLHPFGGAFEVDRVLARVGGLVDEVAFQTSQKIRAVRSEFANLFINGDEGSVATEFDGLDVLLTGTDTEYGASDERDWTAITSQADAFGMLDEFEAWLSTLHMKPDMIFGNTKSISRMKNLARWAGYRTESEDAFGRKADRYDGILLVDLGEKPSDSSSIIPIETRDPDGDTTSTTGLTDLYAASFSLEGVHGVTLADAQGLIQTYLDEFSPEHRISGAVRRGEIEMVSALALRHTKAAGVFRNVKVQ